MSLSLIMNNAIQSFINLLLVDMCKTIIILFIGKECEVWCFSWEG